MQLILATNYDELDNFIEDLKGIEVLQRVHSAVSLVDKCEDENPDLLVVSTDLTGASTNKIIASLGSSKFFTGRVLLLVPHLTEETNSYITTMLNVEFNDFIIGDVDSDEISDLIANSRTRKSAEKYLSDAKKKSKFVEETKVKVVEKTTIIESENCFSVVSASSNGKSFITWSLALALVNEGYKVNIVSFDVNKCFNTRFDIDDNTSRKTSDMISRGLFKGVATNCFKSKEGIGVVSVPSTYEKSGEYNSIANLLTYMKSACDILLVDCSTNLDILKDVLAYSSKVLIVFDQDVSHFNANFDLLSTLGNFFRPSKSLALLNRTVKNSQSFKEVLKNIRKSAVQFNDVCFMQDLASEPCDSYLMDTEYQDFSNNLKSDLAEIIKCLNCAKSKSNKKSGGLFGIFK